VQKNKQKLRFLLNKSAAQTVAAIMKKLKVKDVRLLKENPGRERVDFFFRLTFFDFFSLIRQGSEHVGSVSVGAAALAEAVAVAGRQRFACARDSGAVSAQGLSWQQDPRDQLGRRDATGRSACVRTCVCVCGAPR